MEIIKEVVVLHRGRSKADVGRDALRRLLEPFQYLGDLTLELFLRRWCKQVESRLRVLAPPRATMSLISASMWGEKTGMS